ADTGPLAGGVTGAGFCSWAAAGAASRTARTAGVVRRNTCVMASPLLSIRTIVMRPDRTRSRGAAQRRRVRSMGGAAGRADFERQRARELVVIEPAHEPVDHPD